MSGGSFILLGGGARGGDPTDDYPPHKKPPQRSQNISGGVLIRGRRLTVLAVIINNYVTNNRINFHMMLVSSAGGLGLEVGLEGLRTLRRCPLGLRERERYRERGIHYHLMFCTRVHVFCCLACSLFTLWGMSCSLLQSQLCYLAAFLQGRSI